MLSLYYLRCFLEIIVTENLESISKYPLKKPHRGHLGGGAWHLGFRVQGLVVWGVGVRFGGLGCSCLGFRV